MDLSFLIPSKVRRQALAYFVENPNAKVYVRELARELRLSPQTVHRELVNLENGGFLFSSAQGNQRVFRVNQKFPLYLPIRDLWLRFKNENGRKLTIDKIYSLKTMQNKLRKIPVPNELITGLTAPRKKPRAWAEEKILKKLQHLYGKM